MTLSTRKVVMHVSPGATQEDDCAVVLNETSPPVGPKIGSGYPDLLQGGWNRAFNDFTSGQSFRGETSYVRVHHAGQGGGAWYNFVFADDGGHYAMIGEGGGSYCVDLRISVPSGTPSGSYQDEIALQDLIPMYLTRPTPAPSSSPTPIPTPTPSPTPTPVPTPDANIYTVNSYPLNGVNGTIPFYSQGNYAPPPQMLLSGLPGASWDTEVTQGLAFDSHGDLWVAYHAYPSTQYGSFTNAVAEFLPGATSPIKSIEGSATDLTYPAGIAIDKTGDVYVADNSNAIYVFAATASGDAAPIKVIAGANTQLKAPTRLLFDNSGNLWVDNAGSGGILEFAASASGNVAPINSFFTATWATDTENSNQFTDFAMDLNGNIYVPLSRYGGFAEYPPSPGVSTLPIREFQLGGTSGVQTLTSFGVDDHDFFYGVDTTYPYGIVIYSPSATGLALPYATITGSAADLYLPEGIALWINSNDYYLN